MSLDALRTALADRYRIERELGRGGMATVYLAEDLKHHRRVAVKVMRPELAASLGAERFLREVEIAAQLSHPNILPVFDSGESGGFLYYVTPYIEGESLPDRIQRERQLPVAEALRLAREVAEALSYAHARGFVHRDIKPANILLHAGHALVADFGIARAVSDGGQALTQTGLAIGTPQYMSPEQATASSDVDGRSDIYALGCVLYEMIAGEPPFSGPTAHAVLARALTETARPLEQTRSTIAPEVSTAVMKAMARTPADRFTTGAEMAAALLNAEDRARTPADGTTAFRIRRGLRPWQLALGVIAVLALGALGMKVLGGGSSTPAAAAIKTVAVLPFDNLGSAEDAYFADGVVTELRDKLARLAQLTVTAAASADQYRGTTKTVPDIARELRVDQVLTGNVRWAPGSDGRRQARIATELIDGKTGAVTWRETFDADVANAFEVQGLIATRVARALGTLVAGKEAQSLAGRSTDNAEAYDIFLKAAAVDGDGPTTYRQRVNLLEQVVALDPKFARAWAYLSSNLSTIYSDVTKDTSVARRAKEALDRVMELASDSAGAHLVAADYYRLVVHDPAAARRSIARALELDPKNLSALLTTAQFDLEEGNFQPMFEKLTTARQLNPLARGVLTRLISAQIYTGHLEEALASSKELLALEPESLNQIQTIVFAHLAVGDSAGARAVINEVLKRVPVAALAAHFAGYQERAYLLSEDARSLLFRMSPAAFDNDRAWWAQALATAAYQQGDKARARAYSDSGLAVALEQVNATPNDPQLRVLYAVMLAYAGQSDAAIRERDQAVASITDGYPPSSVAYVHLQAVRVDLALDRLHQAMDGLEKLLERPEYITRHTLAIDPMFTPLKGNARFERMKTGGLKVPVD